ncbi:hypothetical protein C1A40_06045 [Tamlana carrageenivorans]|uniref:Uncharacterized protein n=2 Tax=Pseudotamlana carrageenivorans TaxID=2069432 RepID=A0A2I7SGN8_9FLAO|nr:hypothetical protein C1A40_06045 [Tamlana carrageenivorans]
MLFSKRVKRESISLTEKVELEKIKNKRRVKMYFKAQEFMIDLNNKFNGFYANTIYLSTMPVVMPIWRMLIVAIKQKKLPSHEQGQLCVFKAWGLFEND